MGGGIIWRELEGLHELSLGEGRIPVIKKGNPREHRVRLAQGFIPPQGLLRGCTSFGENLPWGCLIIRPKSCVRFSQSQVCVRVGWILFQGLIEVRNRLPQVRGS